MSPSVAISVRVQGLGFRVWGSGFRFKVWGLGFRVQGLGFMVQDLGSRSMISPSVAISARASPTHSWFMV